MNNSTISIKKLVILKNGAKAMLALSPNRKRATIEYYEPSKAYWDRIREMKQQEEKLAKLREYPYPDLFPFNSEKFCRYIANNIVNKVLQGPWQYTMPVDAVRKLIGENGYKKRIPALPERVAKRPDGIPHQ